MGYTKQVWAIDTPVTPERLNHLETQFDEIYAVFTAHLHDGDYYTKTQMETVFWYQGNDGAASGLDADLIYHPSGNMHAADLAGAGVPVGLIIYWPYETVPTGWHLCDGTAGTPDLRGLFIIGAGNLYNPGNTGGSATVSPTGTVNVAAHALTASEIRGHRHSFPDKYANTGSGGWNSSQVGTWGYYVTPLQNTGTTSSTGQASPTGHIHESSNIAGDSGENRPPYYVLSCIQKV